MSSLKLIMAVSADGFVSNGPDDHMDWAGPDDKRAFRLLTSVGGVLGAGRTTFQLLSVLRGRTVMCLSNRRIAVPDAETREIMERPIGGSEPVSATAGYTHAMRLGQFAHQFPNGWLIGGQTVALEALQCGLVEQVYMCKAPIELRRSMMFNPLAAQVDRITPLIQKGNWQHQERVRIGDTLVEVWRHK